MRRQAEAKLKWFRDMAQVTVIQVSANEVVDACGSDEAWSLAVMEICAPPWVKNMISEVVGVSFGRILVETGGDGM